MFDYLAASADPRIRLCDLKSGAFTHSLPGHRGTVLAVEWSPRHEFLLASGRFAYTLNDLIMLKQSNCIVRLTIADIFTLHTQIQHRLDCPSLGHPQVVGLPVFLGLSQLQLSTPCRNQRRSLQDREWPFVYSGWSLFNHDWSR